VVYRHALAMFQELEAPHLYVEQGIGYLHQLLTHGAIHSTTGDLLLISLEQAQLEFGIRIPFLEASFDFYGFLLADTWWKTVWAFIWKYSLQLTYPDQTIPQPQRICDAYIMELLCSHSELTREELLSCNRC
jgi:hypothetical protein